MNALLKLPPISNEPVLNYAPGSPERQKLQAAIAAMRQEEKDIPMYIGDAKVFTNDKVRLAPPHDHQHTLGHFNRGTAEHVQQAIAAALAAKNAWETMPFPERAAIFLKAADLLAGPYRAKINAATVLGQSKTAYQAEIDSACELIDFYRFNVKFLFDLYEIQPESSPGIWNQMEYRPLEGFVFAITPFNFTAIAGNLPGTPALMGNTVVWKPADTQIYSAQVIMEVLLEAGLPPGVINLIYTDGPVAGDVIFKHPQFSGLHFTGSTAVFRQLWKTIGAQIDQYHTYPRIVGETGGKDFIVAHPSAHIEAVATAISRGAFEFQGQKCSAASRAYLPKSIADQVLALVKADVESFKVGSAEDFQHFVSAVIDEKAFDKIAAYIDHARNATDAQIFVGGQYDKSKGYFIHPTVILTENPQFRTMCEEIFGPVITIYVYPDEQWESMLSTVDQTSVYALTGAIFSQDRAAIVQAKTALRHSAGNFYVNDKPTGAVVNQQPFGGARASGTNDKAGAIFNLIRWVSVRSIKETFVPPTDYRYPFLNS
jgi:1-pyrroline-5-carboxylate dehydrogenase